MKMLFLAVLAPLLQLAAAVPAPAPAPGPVAELSFPDDFNSTEWLSKRGDGTGVHLVNCDGFGGEGTIIPPNSMVVVRIFPTIFLPWRSLTESEPGSFISLRDIKD